jgi:PAS domain S-box-containing protein
VGASADTTARPWNAARARAAELRFVAALILSVVLGLLAITGFGLAALESVRGYVTGEGLYSKAQKSAIYFLARYAETGAQESYWRYLDELAIPGADAEARIALERQEPDAAAATAAFLRGRNHPEDVPNMVRLFRAAAWLPEMERAIEIWREGDRGVEEIAAIGEDIRVEIEGARRPERIAALLAQLDQVDERMTVLESEFSFTLGAGSRRVQRIIFAGAAASGLLFFVITLLTAGRWLARQRRSERLFRSLTEDAQDIVNLIDREGRLRYVSPAVERALGWRQDELLDRSAFELIHPEDAAGVVERIGYALEHANEAVSAEFRFRRKDGSWRSFESTGRLLPASGGPPLLIVVSRDVTERLELEERLREAQKMESLGRLAGGVAHDFNNLLTAILGGVQLLQRELPEGSRERSELEEIARSGERAARLTSQLLAFARRQPVQLRVVDLAELVQSAQGLLRRLIRDEIELDGARRARAARAGAREPGGERARRDRGRGLHHGGDVSRERAGASLGERHRQRHERRGAAPRLRALLHHEAAGPGRARGSVSRPATASSSRAAAPSKPTPRRAAARPCASSCRSSRARSRGGRCARRRARRRAHERRPCSWWRTSRRSGASRRWRCGRRAIACSRRWTARTRAASPTPPRRSSSCS